MTTDPVVTAPALSAHDAAMVAKVDQRAASMAAERGDAPVVATTPAPVVTAPTRPESVPEKFWDASKGQVNTEALLRSYAELERGRSAPPVVPPAVVVPPVPVVPPVEGDAIVAPVVAAAPPAAVDLSVYSAEFAAAGGLSEASYAALETGGYPKALVDQFIAGQQATIAAYQNAVYASAGGEAEYRAMGAWAVANLSPADIAAFDQSVSTPNVALAQQAVTALKARFTAANGTEPALTSGDGGQAGGEGAFGSRAEVVQAMSDPRYKKDPAYRALVSRRIDGMQVF